MRHASTSPPASSSSAKRLCSFFVKPGVPRSSTLRPLNPRANPRVSLLGSPLFRCATRVCCAMSLHSIDDEAKKRRRDACITAPHGSVSPDLGIVLATRLTKADIGNVQIVQRHVEVTCPHELVLRSGMKWPRLVAGTSIGCARSMICYLGARGVLVGLLAALEALGLAIHLTRLSLRAMFGSAGELTRPAGCSDTRHDWCFGIPQQLSQGSSTHSLTHRSTRAACPLLLRTSSPPCPTLCADPACPNHRRCWARTC